MSSGKNTHIVNGWKAFSYFCCSAWNDTYLVDISKAAAAGDLGTQRAQFVPVTQMYKSIDNLMGQQKLYSAFEYPMAPDTGSSTPAYIHTNFIETDGDHAVGQPATNIKGNLKTADASGIVFNYKNIKETDRLDNSFNVMGQGVKAKSKYYDCLKVTGLQTSKEYSMAVTPTRWSYFGQNQGNLVANTKPQRVVYIISAEIRMENDHDVQQMKLVKNEFDLDSPLALLVRPDMEMDTAGASDPNSAIKSIEFGNVTCSYSYNWDVMGASDPQTGREPKPLNQSGNTGNKYMVISAVPTEDNADPRAYVNFLNDEFYGVSIKSPEDETLSFGYISYQSLGDKAAFEPALEQGAEFGYTFPRSALTAYQNASVWDNNWFKTWNNAYGNLAAALQGTADAGSENFTAAFLGKASNLSENEKSQLGFSRLVNQSATVNTNHLEKFIYLKTNNRVSANAEINVYVSVLEDWIDPANALDSLGIMSSAVNGAAYIPYLDANASRQIVSQDYDIWDSGDVEGNGGDVLAANVYTVGDKTKTQPVKSNVNVMVPHQSLDLIVDFPDFKQATGVLDDKTSEPNKDLLLFDWRAKTLAQPTFACCELDKIVELGLRSTVVSIDNYAGSFISNNFRNASDTASYILDADLNKFYANRSLAQGGGLSSFIADKRTYIHALDSVFKEQANVANKASELPKLFAKWDNSQGAAAQTTIFNNFLTELPSDDAQDILNARYTKLPWFTWEGLSLPLDPTPKPPAGFVRLNITKNGVTALVSVIRTASLMVTGMVINQELNFSFNEVCDAITTKTLYTAWWNTQEFFKQLTELQIGNTINPEVSSDFPTDTVAMPTWMEVLTESNHVKVKQFFRSKFCTEKQLKKLIGNETDENPAKNFPPTTAVRNAAIRTKTGVENVKDKQFKYYEIGYDDINKIEYPSKSDGGKFKADMYPANISLEVTAQISANQVVPNDVTPLRGMLRPIMWDPKGKYPNHMLIPMERRGVELGTDWDALLYISCDGTLKNSGNVLQQVALNYRNEDENGDVAWQVAESGRIMYCAPYVPVGDLHVCNPSRETDPGAAGGSVFSIYTAENSKYGPNQTPNSMAAYTLFDMYRHQQLSKQLANHGSLLSGGETLALEQIANTGDDYTGSDIYRTNAAALNCGPPLEQGAAVAGTIDISFGNYNSGDFDANEVANLLKSDQDKTLKIRFGPDDATAASLSFTVTGTTQLAGRELVIRKGADNSTATKIALTVGSTETGTDVSGQTFDLALDGVTSKYEFLTNAAATGTNVPIQLQANGTDNANAIAVVMQGVLNGVAGQSAISANNVVTVTHDTKGAPGAANAAPQLTSANVSAKLTAVSTNGTDDSNFYKLVTFNGGADPTAHADRIIGVDVAATNTSDLFAQELHAAFTAVATDVSSGFNSVLSPVDKLGFRGIELTSRSTGSILNTEGMLTGISSEIIDATDLAAGNNLANGGTDDVNFITLVSNRVDSEALNRVELNTSGLTNGNQLASLVEDALLGSVNALNNAPVAGAQGSPSLALASLSNKLTVSRTDNVVTLTLKTATLAAQTAANTANGAANGAIVAVEAWGAGSSLFDDDNTAGFKNEFADGADSVIQTNKIAASSVMPVALGYNKETKAMDMAYNKRRLKMHTIVPGHVDQGGLALYTRNNNMGLGMLAMSDLNNKLVDLGEGYNIDSVIATNAQKDHFVNDSLHRTQTFIAYLLSGYGLYSDKLYKEEQISGNTDVAKHPLIDDHKAVFAAANNVVAVGFSSLINSAAATIAGTAITGQTFVDASRVAFTEFSDKETYRNGILAGKRKRFLSGPHKALPCSNVDILNYRVSQMDELHSKNSDANGYKWVGPSSHFMAEPNTADIWRYIKNDSPLTNRSIVPGRNEYKTRTEAFASAGSGMLTNVKTYLHNGIGDGSDKDSVDDLISAIGSAYENGDFSEDRPSLFAITRGFDVSRNAEEDQIVSCALFEADINGLVGLKEKDDQLCYFDALQDKDYADNSEIGRKIKSKQTEIVLFKKALDDVLENLKLIKPCPDRSSLHFSDHHYTTLPSDESLQQALINGPAYSTNKYLRLQSDMMEYLRKEQTILDLTNLASAKSEKKMGGAFVEGMYYVDDLSSSTIRIFYPTPLREDFVRPEKNNGLVAAAMYVADTCKGVSMHNTITGVSATNKPASGAKVVLNVFGTETDAPTDVSGMMISVKLNDDLKKFILFRDRVGALASAVGAKSVDIGARTGQSVPATQIAEKLRDGISGEFNTAGTSDVLVCTSSGTTITLETVAKGSPVELTVGSAFSNAPDGIHESAGTAQKNIVNSFMIPKKPAGGTDADYVKGISGESFDVELEGITKSFIIFNDAVNAVGHYVGAAPNNTADKITARDAIATAAGFHGIITLNSDTATSMDETSIAIRNGIRKAYEANAGDATAAGFDAGENCFDVSGAAGEDQRYHIFDINEQTKTTGPSGNHFLIRRKNAGGTTDINFTFPSALATPLSTAVGISSEVLVAPANPTIMLTTDLSTNVALVATDDTEFVSRHTGTTITTTYAGATGAGSAAKVELDDKASHSAHLQSELKRAAADAVPGVMTPGVTLTVTRGNQGSGISGEIVSLYHIGTNTHATYIQLGEGNNFPVAADHGAPAPDTIVNVTISAGDTKEDVAKAIYASLNAAATQNLTFALTGETITATRSDTPYPENWANEKLKSVVSYCDVGGVDDNSKRNVIINGIDHAEFADLTEGGIDTSFNALLDMDVDQEVNVQNHVFGRGGITVHKRNVMLESLEQLPNWDALKDTSGAALLKAFIGDPYANSTGVDSAADSTNVVARKFKVGDANDKFGARTIGINLNMNKATNLTASSPDLVDSVRYRNFSVLTITGPRDFAIPLKDAGEDFNSTDSINYNKQGEYLKLNKKRIYSRIGSVLLQGTNKSTKFVIANHENDRDYLSKSILAKYEDDIMDDGNTKNWAIAGRKFTIEPDTSASVVFVNDVGVARGVGQVKKSFIMTSLDMPAYIANTWNKTTPFICSPSMGSSETHIYEPLLEPGQLLRTNFGVVKKFKTNGVGNGEIGLSANAEMTPVEYYLEVHLVKSPGDTKWLGTNRSFLQSAAQENFEFYYDTNYINNAPAPVNLILRTVELDETEIMNYYKLDTIIFLEKGSAVDSGKPFTEVSRFVRNMPENLQQYLGYMNRTVTAFLQDRPTAVFKKTQTETNTKNLNRNVTTRYWLNTVDASNVSNVLYPGAKNEDGAPLLVGMSAQYDANQLYFEQNLVDMAAQAKEFDKQLMAWNEGIVGAKIGDMVLTDFDNISEEQVVDTSETLTEIPGFHILMWVEAQKLNATDKTKVESKTVITPNHLKAGYCLSAGRNGTVRGIYDGVKLSMYEQDLLVAKGAKTIQNEQIITNRNPVVSALSTRGSITPEKKYEYGVYKENMFISPYKNSIASRINVPVINEVETITHPDSIGLNTFYCEKSDKIAKNGVLIVQHANVLYSNHNGINITIPSELRKLEDAIDTNKCKDWKQNNSAYRLKFCMVAVPENNNNTHGKTGINPGNSALVNIVVRDQNIANVKKNQWALCYDECVVSEYGNNTVTSEFSSEIYDLVSARAREVQRDLQFNMLVDLFRSRNTTMVRTVMTFNKLPRMEQVKTALVKKVLGYVDNNGVTQAATVGVGDAPFLQSATDFARNYMVISRLKYHVDASGEDLGINSTFSGANLYGDRETLYDLFHVENVLDASSNIFTITKLDAARKIKPEELNGANAYKGAPYAKTDLLYGCSADNEGDVSGSILHHYRKYDPAKTGVTGLYVETLVYFTSLLTRPLLDGRSNLTNAFFKVRDVTDGEWDNLPKELFDLNKKFENEMRTYRKTLVSTMIRSMPSNLGSFCTDVLNRTVPKAYLESGKKYNAFAQLEFLATFRDQLMSKKIKDGENMVTLGSRAKFPIYCYLSADGKNILFPSWKEQGIYEGGERRIVYEEEIDYKFAKLYYGDEFIIDLLSHETGFGFKANTPFERTKEFNSRLITSYEEYIAPPQYTWLTPGSKDIFVNIKKHLDSAQNDLPRNLSSEQGYIAQLGLLQIWTPLLETLFILKDNSLQSGGQLAYNDVGIQPDTVIGSHVNTFKNKFDIQNFQLKLNVVRLDLNLLKECTAFEIKEVEFSDNTLLTLDTLSPVGNPQELFLPIMMQTKAEKIETVKSRKVEIKTDYLLETLNDIDVLELMNNIWYRIDEKGNRIVLSPTEVARVPIFRNYPGVMFQNNYEPVLKNSLTQATLLEELELDVLKHIDGNDVKGYSVGEHGIEGKMPTDWTGVGWWLTMHKHLGFQTHTERGQGLRSNKENGFTSFMHPTMPGVWQLNQAGTGVALNPTMNAIGITGSNAGSAHATLTWDNTRMEQLLDSCRLQSKGASNVIAGMHRQRVMPKQITGGFVRSCWLAERLASVVFGKQNFPHFAQVFSIADPVPFNSPRGPATMGKLGSTYGRDYFKKSSPIMQLIADSQYGRLKLSDVRSDDSARGELGDYRYPGIQFDISANTPIFAESVPNTNGAFACQIIRMIKSGLIGRPEDEKIFVAEQDIADQIGGGVYQLYNAKLDDESYVSDVISGDMWRKFKTPLAGYAKGAANVDNAEDANSYNFVFNPQQFMYFKLQEKKSADRAAPYKGGFVPMQYVLQQLLSNDPQRFELNEKEASRHSDYVARGSKSYNKSYTQWRSMVIDNPVPELDIDLMTGDIEVDPATQFAYVANSASYSKWEDETNQNRAEPLVVLPAKGRFEGWNKAWWAAQAAQDHEDAHPLALCIRGLDLDHVTMTYTDLSNNTMTPFSQSPWGEFLKGEASNTAGLNDFGEEDFALSGAAGLKSRYNSSAPAPFPEYRNMNVNVGSVFAYKYGLKRNDPDVGNDQKAGDAYPLYGPAIHATEGNHPVVRGIKESIKNSSDVVGGRPAMGTVDENKGWMNGQGYMDAKKQSPYEHWKSTNPTYWNHQANLYFDPNNKTQPTYAGWNSYIEYTDLTKVYPIYMLPLMASDKISIVVTNEGSLKDPLEVAAGAEGAFDQALKEITDELKGWSSSVGFTNIKDTVDFANINNTAGTGNIVGTDLESNEPDGVLSDYQESVGLVDYPSITGTGMNRDIEAGAHPEYGTSKGLFYDCVNALVAPELGPYEKYIIDEWRHDRFGLDATTQCANVTGQRGEGTVILNNAADLNGSIKYKGNDISKNSTYFIGLYGNNTGCNNSLECLYYHIGMKNYINPGGASGVKYSEFTPAKLENNASHIARTRARYLAHDLSDVPVSQYYQKLVTRSFTIKYGLSDEKDQHEDYNDIRIRQIAGDQVTAFEVKDVQDMPKIDIFDKSNAMRYDYTNYTGFYSGMDDWVAQNDAPASDVDQQMIAKPVLISSSFSEKQKAHGAFLIPRRFDGRPMDPNVPAQNIICIRKDNMRIINAIKGEETREPTQAQLNEAGNAGRDGKMRFSLDLGVPLQGGGLIRCRLPIESADKDDYAVFTDEGYNKDYLVFHVRDWIGNKKPDGSRYPTIKKQNIMANLHDAINKSQIAQLNERLLEPYVSAVAVKKQPPPNTSFDMPVLLPSKPDGAVIEIRGQIQPRTFFQPIDLILNPTAAGEDHFELRPVNHTYYIRISANNKNWHRYVQQARHFGNSGQESAKAHFTVGTTSITNAKYQSDGARSHLNKRGVSADRASAAATHKNFKDMAHPDVSYCTASDLSGIIHDVLQTQLIGRDASGGVIDFDQLGVDASQCTSIFSLDLLALLNMEYVADDVSGAWVHRLSPCALKDDPTLKGEAGEVKVVEPWHVVKLTKQNPTTEIDRAEMYHEFEIKQAIQMKPSTANTNRSGRAILVISDIGKRWVDYEGLAMGRDRFFRLSNILDTHDNAYALAIDDIGGTDVYHGDLASSSGMFDYSRKLDNAALWDASNVRQPWLSNTSQGPFEEALMKYNNPVAHLFRGSYITMDDPTTGAGGIGDWTTAYEVDKIRWGEQNKHKHFNDVNQHWSNDTGADLTFGPLMYDFYGGEGAIPDANVHGTANDGLTSDGRRAHWHHTHHPSDIIFANLTETQRGANFGGGAAAAETEVVYFESARAGKSQNGFLNTPTGMATANSGVASNQTVGYKAKNMNYVREITVAEENRVLEYGITGTKVAAYTLFGGLKPHGYNPVNGALVGDDDEIDASFANINCRPDYPKQTAANYNIDRYGKTYNFVRTQMENGDDGYALFDGLFDNASILFAEAYGKSTHLKSEGMLDNSRFRWSGSCYCKGSGSTVTILKSPHRDRRRVLKAAGSIASEVLPIFTVPGFAFRKEMSFATVLPGVAPVVDTVSNTYYTPSLHNPYQVSETNSDTKNDISCTVNNGTIEGNPLALPSLRTFRLQSLKPVDEDGKQNLPVRRAWMNDQNQRNFWRHIKFFGTKTYTAGVTSAEAEEDVEADSERQLFGNTDISPLN